MLTSGKTIRELLIDLGPDAGEDVADPHSLGGLIAAEFHVIREPWNISIGDATPIIRIYTAGSIPRRIYLAIEDGPTHRWDANAQRLDGTPIHIPSALGPRPRPRWVLCEPV